MKEGIISKILNPICLHCNALCHACRGLTIKDWIKAKNCEAWDFSMAQCSDYTLDERLDLFDYLVGEDTPYGIISKDHMPIKSNEDSLDLKDLDSEVSKL